MPSAQITLPFELQRVESGPAVDSVRALFQEYQAGLGIDLCFQGFAQELAELPGAYAPPAGRLYLALQRREPAGCAALRPLDEATCEMKRLYVRSAYRRRGIGKMLTQRALGDARTIGYKRIVLDTLPAMHEAQALYAALGFAETEPYTFNPADGVQFLALDLAAGPATSPALDP
jgi:ribosomal protein S18 acetylase RimI-like enzyme